MGIFACGPFSALFGEPNPQDRPLSFALSQEIPEANPTVPTNGVRRPLLSAHEHRCLALVTFCEKIRQDNRGRCPASAPGYPLHRARHVSVAGWPPALCETVEVADVDGPPLVRMVADF